MLPLGQRRASSLQTPRAAGTTKRSSARRSPTRTTSTSANKSITSSYVPAIFFCVAMFLLQNALSRLVDTQRTQIGLMKAFGYRNTRVALHYLQFAALIAAAGAAIGARVEPR